MNQLFKSGGQSTRASASVLPVNIVLIPFRIDWFDLLAVQGTLKAQFLWFPDLRKHVLIPQRTWIADSFLKSLSRFTILLYTVPRFKNLWNSLRCWNNRKDYSYHSKAQKTPSNTISLVWLVPCVETQEETESRGRLTEKLRHPQSHRLLWLLLLWQVLRQFLNLKDSTKKIRIYSALNTVVQRINVFTQANQDAGEEWMNPLDQTWAVPPYPLHPPRPPLWGPKRDWLTFRDAKLC